jgi:hypothetical protein
MSGVTSETLRRLAALKLNPEQMAGVLELLADVQLADERRKADQRARVAKHRANKEKRNVTETLLKCYPSLPDDPPASSGNVEDILTNPPKEKDPKGSQKKTPPKWPAGSFDRIWSAYPHKVGKKAVYAKLALIERSAEARPDEIVDGIERYKLAKPEHHDWKNPLTWLNQGCWADEYGTPAGTGPPTNGRHSPHAPLSNVSRRYAEPANKPRSVHDAARDLDLWAEQVSRTRGH